jgi:hypothetical protein
VRGVCRGSRPSLTAAAATRSPRTLGMAAAARPNAPAGSPHALAAACHHRPSMTTPLASPTLRVSGPRPARLPPRPPLYQRPSPRQRRQNEVPSIRPSTTQRRAAATPASRPFEVPHAVVARCVSLAAPRGRILRAHAVRGAHTRSTTQFDHDAGAPHSANGARRQRPAPICAGRCAACGFLTLASCIESTPIQKLSNR